MAKQFTKVLAELKKAAVKPKTAAKAALLQAGYSDLTVEKAQTIIEERKKNPQLWPYEQLQRAEAFLSAYESEARPIATNPGWVRERV